jgi:hypothetical protein
MGLSHSKNLFGNRKSRGGLVLISENSHDDENSRHKQKH